MNKLLKAAAGIVLASALSVSAIAADKLKVGFIYIGPPGDHGWTYQHDQGRQAIEAHFGDKVETVFVENVPEGPDAERTITRLELIVNPLNIPVHTQQSAHIYSRSCSCS
jgi:basic membrane protein A